MADVFISYAREDIDFVRGLHDALRSDDREIWVDWEGIPPSAEWMREVRAAIEAAPSFLFVISPDSVTSRVCGEEIDHAALHSKRIIALVRREPEDDRGKPLPVHDAVGRVNWIFGREADPFDDAVRQVVESLDTDLEHVRTHARLTVRAVEWTSNDHEAGYLIRGRDLADARRWLEESEGKEPEPSPLHRKYVTASREAAADAVASRVTVGFPEDPELGVLLAAAAAAELADTPTARFALRAALAASPLRAVLPGQEGGVKVAEWSHDGTRLATADARGSVQVWDGWAGTRLWAEVGHEGTVTTLSWSPDGASIATGSEDGTARVWETAAGSERAVLRHERLQEGVVTVDWSRDGRRLLTAPKRGTTAVWDLEGGVGDALWLGHAHYLVGARWHRATNRVVLLTGREGVVAFDAETGAAEFGLRLPRPGVRAGVWSPDGSLIATCNGSQAHVWSGVDGVLVCVIVGHGSDITSIAFDPGSRRLATASTDKTVRIWDPRTGDELRRMTRHENSVKSVTWSPDGMKLVTAGADGAARVWDAAKERQVVELRERTASPDGAVWSPDGTRIATFGSDGARVYGACPGDWSLGFVSPGPASPELRGLAEEAEPADSREPRAGSPPRAASASETARKATAAPGREELLVCRWTDAGARILTAWRGGEVEVRDGATGRPGLRWTSDEPLRLALPSPDRSSLLATDRGGRSRVVDLASGVGGPALSDLDNPLTMAVWSLDGSRVLGVGADGHVGVWDASSGDRITRVNPGRAARPGEDPAVAWSPDGTRFLTYLFFSQDEAVRIWHADTGDAMAHLGRADPSQLWGAEWSPDGRWIVIVGADIRLLDPDSGALVRLLEPRGDLFSPGVAFSPAGDRVLVGLESGVAEIWDTTGEGDPLRLCGHDGRVHFGRWSRDGERVVTVSEDATAWVWNASRAEPLAALVGHGGPVHDARWSCDERLILTRSADHSARVWDAGTGAPVVRIGGVDDHVEDTEWHRDAPRALVRTASGAWVWDIELDTEALLEKARTRVSRGLRTEERRLYGLPVRA